MCLLRYHSPVVNFVADCDISTGFDGALVPYGRLVNPMVVVPRIGLGFREAGRRLRYALLAPIPNSR
jgi:hypothetical protein